MKRVQETALIVGVGARQGIGAAVAIKAAEEGLHVVLLGRTQAKLDLIVQAIVDKGGSATSVVMDCTQASEVTGLFNQLAQSNTCLRLLVYNTGRNLPAPFMEHDVRLIEDHWRRCVLGGMLFGQGAIRHMLKQKQTSPEPSKLGTILYTGASASLRGKPLYAGFASAKSALRVMAQSMAREFGPQGIHVGHLVIDGVVDGAIIRSVKGLGHWILRQKGPDGALVPDEVAQTFMQLYRQAPNAWTHELDLRPYKEPF